MSERVLADTGRALRLRGDAARPAVHAPGCESLPRTCAADAVVDLSGDPVLSGAGAVRRRGGGARPRPGVPRAGHPADPATGRADRHGRAGARRDRHRQADRQDRARHPSRGAAAGRGPCTRSWSRWGAGGRRSRSWCARTRCPAWRTCSRSCAAADTPPPTTSRTPSWPVSPPSAAGAAARGRRVRRSSRTSSRASGSRCGRTRASWCSRAAAPRCHRWRQIAPCARPAPPVQRPAPCHISGRCGCCAPSCWSCSARPTLGPAEREAAGRPAGGMDPARFDRALRARARARGGGAARARAWRASRPRVRMQRCASARLLPAGASSRAGGPGTSPAAVTWSMTSSRRCVTGATSS